MSARVCPDKFRQWQTIASFGLYKRHLDCSPAYNLAKSDTLANNKPIKMLDNCYRLFVTEWGSTPIQKFTRIEDLLQPINRLRTAAKAQRRDCCLSIRSTGIYLEAADSKSSTQPKDQPKEQLFETQKLAFCSAFCFKVRDAQPQVIEPLFVFIVRHKKKLQCHAFLCETEADAKTLANCCSAEMAKQKRQAANTDRRLHLKSFQFQLQFQRQASTQEAPKRRLDIREDECANLTPKGFVLIDAILGLLTACFAK